MAAVETPGMANGPCVEEPIIVWRKSDRSMSNGACVEVGVSWIRS